MWWIFVSSPSEGPRSHLTHKKIECQQAEGDRVRMIGLSPMTTDNRLRTTEAGAERVIK